MRGYAAGDQHRRLHAGYLIVLLASIAGLFVLDGVPRAVLFLLIGLVPVGAVSRSLLAGRLPDRRPWRLIVAGMVLVSASNCLGVVDALGVTVPGADVASQVLVAAGGIALLGACLVVVIRHVPNDGGGVIDAALSGVGMAGPAWEFLLRPKLAELQASGPATVIALVNLLISVATLAALMRIARTADRARVTLRYLYLASGSSVAGTMLSLMLSADTPGGASWSQALWATSYLCLAAGVLHPSAAHLTEPQGLRLEGLSSIRLAYLGAVLAVNPIIGTMPEFWGDRADAPLLGIGTLAVIGLVVTRIGQLLRQRHEAQLALAYQASHDELTGLPNRRSVLARLDEALSGRTAGATGGVGVLYCDLDGFKPINDELGHRAGDEVLRVTADRLLASVRAGDTVGRIGGDEFMIVCTDLDEPGAMALRQRIQDVVGEPMRVEGAEVSVQVTIGIALAAPGETGPDRLVTAADQAMYARKRQRPAFA